MKLNEKRKETLTSAWPTNWPEDICPRENLLIIPGAKRERVDNSLSENPVSAPTASIDLAEKRSSREQAEAQGSHGRH